MTENLNPEQQLEYLKELRAKYEEVLSNAQKTGDYSEAEKLKEELNERLSALEAQFPKRELEELDKNSIENEGNYEAKFEKVAIPILKKCLEKNIISPGDILLNLAGMSGREALKLRDQAYVSFVGIKKDIDDATTLTLMGYAGVDTVQAWNYRDINREDSAVLFSVAGLDSERSWRIRDRSSLKHPSAMLGSLRGLDSDKAWQLRELIIKNNKNYLHLTEDVLMSLAGLDSEKAWEFRDSIRFENSNLNGLESLAYSIVGLDSDRAWKIRKFLQDKAQDPRFNAFYYSQNGENVFLSYLARSLAGVDSEKAWDLRSKLDQKYVLKSLAGLNNEIVYKSWQDSLEGSIENSPSSGWISGINGNPVIAIGWRTARKNKKKQS